MSVVITVLKLFVRTDSNLILFNSFGGKKYDDSPKVLFEAMIEDERFKDYKFVWAFHNPQQFNIRGADKIKTDSFKYYYTALSARIWITNSSIERGLNFKGKNTFYLNTWHGSPVKKFGTDISKESNSFKTKGKNNWDVINSQSSFDSSIFPRCFNISKDRLLEVGLPRNDALVNYTEKDRELLRQKFQIPDNKKVILYCPTYREYTMDDNYGILLAPPMDLEKWEKELGDEFVVFFRAHYEVYSILDFKENEFVRNMTDYPFLDELMIVSDILLSDYSSIYCDYSIMDKAMLHFTYDYDLYNQIRGLNIQIKEYLSGSDNEDELLSIIKEMDYPAEIEKTKRFRHDFMNYYGNASKLTIDYIANSVL